jgi:hypothetical protein
MRPRTLRTTPLACLLAVVTLLTACGGSQDPILGTGSGTKLAPQVSATAPLASTPVVADVAVNTQVTATFNKAMNPDTLNTSTFTLACPAELAVSGTVSYDATSRVATFAPAGNLPLSTRCVATVTTGAQDTLGTPLAAPFVWAFDTGASIDEIAPTVTGQTPAQDAVAATNTQVTVTFSEDMAPATLSASSFTLKTSVGDTPVLGTVSYAVGVGSTGVKVSLATTAAQATGGSGSDTLINIENLIGSKYADQLTGNTGNNIILQDNRHNVP